MRAAGAALVTLSAVVVVGTAAPAWGHATLEGSEPAAGAKVDAVPATVGMSFAEPPTKDSKVTITDGCKRDVAGTLDILNSEIDATVVAGAQPGRWRVEATVVSAVDGHATTSDFSFRVTGTADCSMPTERPTEQAAPPNEDSSSLPVVPLAVATAALVGVALLARMRTKP